MDKKYSNIFWHQGIKIFEEDIYKTRKGLIKITHLENDVTKALINLFQHCSKEVLAAFLKLINVKDAPETFEFDFQVTDSNKYRQKVNRLMLSIISASTQIKSDSAYYVKQSIPDACIFNKNAAILIESKTQSPLVPEQIEAHIKHYLGSATKERRITWELISEKFHLIKQKISTQDRFLVSQFCEFLELIGIAEFNGFIASDFSMLGSLGKIPDEDYLDFKRMVHSKIEKFMAALDKAIEPEFRFKKYARRIQKANARQAGTWSAFYFYDHDPEIHVNKYPNINFNYGENGIQLSLNAEIKESVNRIISRIKKNPRKFDAKTKKSDSFFLNMYYKLQFLPMNNFVGGIIPGYPKDIGSFKSEYIIKSIDNFQKNWADFKNTILFEMKSGAKKHEKGRFFNEKELAFAEEKNAKPTYMIRIQKQYSVAKIESLKKNVIPFFTKEILQLKDIVEFMNV